MRSPDGAGGSRVGLRHRELSDVVRSATLDDTNRSFEAILTTDAPAAVYDRGSLSVIDEVIVTSGVRLLPNVPVLDSHRRESVEDILGHVGEHRIEEGGYVGRLYLATPDEGAADRSKTDRASLAWQLVRQGHLTGVSIGYWPREYTDIAAGKRASVGGLEYTAGSRTLRVTTLTEVFEVSLVSVPADRDALIRSLDAERESRAKPAAFRRRLHLTTIPRRVRNLSP